jgi:hypothetical protein
MINDDSDVHIIIIIFQDICTDSENTQMEKQQQTNPQTANACVMCRCVVGNWVLENHSWCVSACVSVLYLRIPSHRDRVVLVHNTWIHRIRKIP